MIRVHRDSDEVAHLLRGYGILPCTDLYNVVRASLEVTILQEGKDVRIHQIGCFQNDKIYFNKGDGNLIRISVLFSGEPHWEVVPNGTDDVLMHDPCFRPFPDLDESFKAVVDEIPYGLRVTDSPVSKEFNIWWKPGQMSAAQQHQIFLSKIVSLWLDNMFRKSLIMFAVGSQDSGKPSIFDKIVLFLYGS